MGLNRQSILKFLLPASYREQVLGDLQERGFQLHDAISVVPQIWWSHLYRACTPPHFTIAGAGGLQLRLRSHARRSVLNACLTGACLGILNGGVYREWSVRRVSVTLTAAMAAYALSLIQLRFQMPKLPASRDSWQMYYRGQLASELRYARHGGALFLLLLTLVQVAQEVWPALNTGDLLIRVGYILVVYALAVAMNRPRVHFVRTEIEGLR